MIVVPMVVVGAVIASGTAAFLAAAAVLVSVVFRHLVFAGGSQRPPWRAPRLGVLDKHPGDGFTVIGRHAIALGDRCCRARRAFDLPHAAFRAGFPGAGFGPDRGTFRGSETHMRPFCGSRSSRRGVQPCRVRRPDGPPEGMALCLPSHD
jgi:hypothetical protein